MNQFLASQWSPFLLRGIVALIVGFVVVCWPALTLFALSVLFACLAMADVLALIVSATRSAVRNRFWLFSGGVVGTMLGAMTLIIPGLSLVAMSYLIAGWAIGTGTTEVITAWSLRTTTKNGYIWLLVGAFSICFGVIVALKPAVGIAFLLYAVAAYAIVAGFALITLALRIRSLDSAPLRATLPQV